MTFLWFKRMATAYEAQFGSICIRWCFLKGEYWAWKPWKRLSIKRYPN